MRRHPTDAVSLGFGLAFLIFPLLWVVLRDTRFSLPDLAWLVAAALVVVGVLGIAGALRGARREPGDHD
jgi:hypothetical protein